MATSLIIKLILSVYITEQYFSAQAVESLTVCEDKVKIEDYPFYAALNNCGAAILSDIWVMTAAHCIEDVNLQKQNYVWVGGETFGNSIRVPYKHIHKHQGYSNLKGLPNHDIALIKLSYPLKFSKKIQPIKLQSGPISNTNIIFVDRGIDAAGGGTKILKKVEIIKLSTMECIKLIPPQFHIFIQANMKKYETSNICAKREGDMPSICEGDSGSPLISGDTVVGLASFIGNVGCRNVKLGFFVNVTYHVPWIKTVTGMQ